MQGRPHRRVAAGVVLALACGCAPRQVEVVPPPLADGLGAVQLRLEGFGAPPRATQQAPSFARARLRIDGATMAAEKTTIVSFALGGSEMTIGNAPIGRNMVFVVEGLDSSDQPLPGARYGTVVDITPGATVSARVGALTTPRAEVVLALLAQDRAASRSVDQAFSVRLDDEALQSRLESERARLGLVHPVLFDASAIARAIASSAAPAATTAVVPPSDFSTFVREPGRVRVRLKGLPSGAKASVWLDDPISPKQQNLAAGLYDILPVAPGTWTLAVESPGGYATSRRVTVTSGLTGAVSEVEFDLGRWEVLPSLAKPLAAALCVPMTLQGVSSLVLVGGLDGVPAPDDVTRYATASCYAYDGTRMAPLPSLPAPLSFASGVVKDGRLYVLGGRTEAGELSSNIYGFNGSQWTTATSSTAFAGAASIAYGSSIYLFGGTMGHQGVAYDLDTGAFRDAPDMALAHVAPASVVYQERLYLFGGGNQSAPLPGSEVFDPTTNQWRVLANMPSERLGARAVVLGDRIYVIGGVDRNGAPSARVDVYDPAANTWSLFGALQTPRGAAAVGNLGGRIYVIGGCDGALATLIVSGAASAKPVAVGAVEALRP